MSNSWLLGLKATQHSFYFNQQKWAITLSTWYYSPNATVVPQGLNKPPLVTAKAYVKILKSQYDENKLDILFDDGHQSGSYCAEYLRRLCEEQDQLWSDYLARVSYAKQLKDNAISLTISD
ncbi:gamma-butyrobetaine hydroxylase-like domain-containing protein [Psychrobium sp. nBUS_13]|uniref:gamma-butyrobetaine hydroxylase-like domain-containing protein n=1 Tax=Psychrobium sp. nBUS_13 TaxID=3395319 RepID=UPI003EBA0348